MHYDVNLSFKPHIEITIARARATSNFILRSFKSREPNMLFKLFKTYVIPILEDGSSLWNPHIVHYVDSIEDIQRKFTRRAFIRSNVVPSYTERLTILGSHTLKHRRLLADLCLTFSVIRNFSCIPAKDIFNFSRRNDVSRSHPYQIVPPRFSSSNLSNSFNARVTNSWNALPANLTYSASQQAFRIACSLYLSSLPP